MLDRLNQKLEKVKIRQKGNRLYLRATLPPKRGDGGWRQAEIATGCPATDDGCKAAFGKAQKLESDLIFDKFQWNDWIASEKVIAANNCESWVEAFEKAFWESRQRTPSREKTYYRDYGVALAQLPLDEPLIAATLKKQLLKTEPGTRSRERNWNAYSALARFAGVELPKDWKQLKGNYKPKPRYIPSDAEILEIWNRLPLGPWKWAFAVFACYGIRSHEIVRLGFEDLPALNVLRDSKTRERLVYPILPEWYELMEIEKINQPKLTSDINCNNGRVATKAFKRLKIGFSPYSLRDGYAIRCAKVNISPAVAARWLGHSLSVHHRSYLRHLDKLDYDEIWRKLSEKQLGKN